MTDTSEAVHLDPSDPYAREEQTFPSLSEEMAARIAAYLVRPDFGATELDDLRNYA